MKKEIKYFIGIMAMIFIISSSSVIFDVEAYRNSPDYSNKSETPYKPGNYNFDTSSTGTYTKSHYGTHDWIADAALRLLYEFDSSSRWRWLIHDLNDKSPEWNNNYGTAGKHNVVRSYITFLFATQMPDMKKEMNKNVEPKKHPIKIDLMKNEGEIIQNLQAKGIENWIGQQHKQTFRWIPIHLTSSGENKYKFVTVTDSNHQYKSPLEAEYLARKAIICLTHKERNENTGELENWAKPEAAASYLGSMTHFISDVACPVHILRPSDYYFNEIMDEEHKLYVEHYVSGWHSSFERKVALYTTWDPIRGTPKGYYKSGEFFVIDLFSKIGKSIHKIPAIPPYLSTILMARKGIEIGFGQIDGNGYDDFKGRRGLYINSKTKRKLPNSKFWDWFPNQRTSTQPIIAEGLSYKDYYDKIELILNWAIYYTACAMKWTMIQVENSTRGDLNYNKWAKKAYDEIPNPVPNPIPDWDKLEDELSDSHKQSWFYINLGRLIILSFPLVANELIQNIILLVIFKKKTLS
ncbi:MAG: hypothetical protein GF317_17690 [Candidatus Lokiarchaeota archaeon]|nr:hypothetical protein [Candidatus Lokiarchaeota archaeon]MBD3201347.1 hypothetical protein [Candidatus Lokiarchaeota archaeon]